MGWESARSETVIYNLISKYLERSVHVLVSEPERGEKTVGTGSRFQRKFESWRFDLGREVDVSYLLGALPSSSTHYYGSPGGKASN